MAEDHVAGQGLKGEARAGSRRRELVRGTELGLVITLVAQYLLGMVINLFVSIPESHPGSNPAEYFSGVVQSVAWAVTDGGVSGSPCTPGWDCFSSSVSWGLFSSRLAATTGLP